MSLSQLIDEHVSAVFLNTNHFAESIKLLKGGDAGRISSVTGIVTWYQTTPELQNGQATHRRGEVLFSSSVNITTDDALKIGDERANVETVGPDENGMIKVGISQRLPKVKGAAPLRTGGY